MKKNNFLLTILASLLLILAACSNNGNQSNSPVNTNENVETETAYQYEDINPDIDICEVCAMAIADDQYATQIILTNHRALKFDDIGDLFVWMNENGTDDIGEKFVRDFHSEEWIILDDATYVYDESIETPMCYGVISFTNEDDAKAYIEKEGLGTLLTATDLNNHEWAADHHKHHGFHTDGFDMEFEALENVRKGEENSLETRLTLHNEALTDANVRYEIWPDDDKSRTEWIDADEVSDGTYAATYHFTEAENYNIQIHVQDDADLHEHIQVEVNVKE